jgi:hypothetical protein
MTRRFGIYAKVTPKQPRLVLTIGQRAFYANNSDDLRYAFGAVRCVVSRMPFPKRDRPTQRPHLQSQSRPVVARLVRNRNRGAASGMAQ